ncbi:hypothetical protein [Allorhodopirellula solitaria]|uniref:Uncharacterized protein n=1 Tax=Allorhodopirellula solitaria TaxID=2527987 RepID=A0A5C5WYK3_9BACT|nr:hypothetical protein [Allorhodopirellula solitaria]TWT55349.1 hypothetical protein CA85_49760 [Allorhodopirellula solitaria]
MTPNLDLFLEACAGAGVPRLSWLYTFDSGHRLTLAAQFGDLSPVLVHDYDDEFVVDLGTKHHTHFHGSRYPDATDMAGAAKDAAQFVFALMSDGVCVSVDYLDGRCIGSSHFFLDAERLTPGTVGKSQIGIRGGNIHTERFTWSGSV